MAVSSYLFAATYVARKLGVDLELIEEIAFDQMGPEDGCFFVVDSDDENAESLTAFTRRGIECLEELLQDYPLAQPTSEA